MTTRPNYVLIRGAYGFRNLGDEAMLHVLRGHWSAIRPGDEIVVSTVDTEETARLHGLEAVRGISPWSMLKSVASFRTEELRRQVRVLKRLEYLVIGGGSLLTDARGVKNLFGILTTSMLAKWVGAKVVLWGVSVGPVSGGLGRRALRSILRGADVVIVRDERSKRLAAEIAGTQIELRRSADLLFGLDVQAVRRTPDADSGSPELRIGLSLRPTPASIADCDRFDRALIGCMADICSRTGSSVEARFTPILFSQGTGRGDDRAILDEVIKGAPDAIFEASVYGFSADNSEPIDASLDRMLNALRSLDVLIGERFHSLVLAALTATPFVALSYDPKISELAADLGLSRFCVELSETLTSEAAMEIVRRVLARALEERAEIREQLQRTVPELQRLAAQDVRYVLESVA